VRSGLLAPGARAVWTPLAGGVSSDVWRVDTPDRVLCVKHACERLKVAAEWHVPRSRSSSEWAYLGFAVRHAPGSVPRPLAHDASIGIIAMEFLDPATHPVWKHELMAQRIEPRFASSVGALLAGLHAASAGDAILERSFATIENFTALRLDPYLLACARVHPALARVLQGLIGRTAGARITLVHGDVSPKNILVGPGGPVFLDAECAWFGDPAFDLAFCLTHLLLKCLVHLHARDRYLDSFRELVQAYLREVTWEPSAQVETRAASLLPALLLARVDGKSPVEYLTESWQKQLVRRVARDLLVDPSAHLAALAELWGSALSRQ